MTSRSSVRDMDSDIPELQPSSPHVSDSEDELSLWTLSNERLNSYLTSRLERKATFKPRSTGALKSSTSKNIKIAFSKALIRSLNPPSPSYHSPAMQLLNNETNETSNEADDVSILSLPFVQENRRSSRRRNISFYQQHIYTIDSVSYILKISLEDATELVKQRPEIIDMYHIGKLEKYLKNGFKLEEPQKQNKRHKNKDGQDKEAPSSQKSASDAENFSESDENSYDSSFSSEYDSTSDVETPNEAPQNFSFRGRIYRDLDAVARASGLPKSYFSAHKATKQRKVVRRRNDFAINQIGVAKKKKAAFHDPTTNNIEVNDIFTTGALSQDNVQILSSPIKDHNHNSEAPVPHEKDVDLRLESTEAEQHGSKNFDGILSPFESQKHYSVEESDGDVVFLKEGQIHGGPKTTNAPVMFDPIIGNPDMFYMLPQPPSESFDTRQLRDDDGIDRMLPGGSRRSGVPRNRGSSKKSSTSSMPRILNYHFFKPRGTKERYMNSMESLQKSIRNGRRKNGTKVLKRTTKLRALSNVNHNSFPSIGKKRSVPSKSLAKEAQKKKPKIQSMWSVPAPRESRDIEISTLVYEGLSDKFSVIKHPRKEVFSHPDSETPGLSFNLNTNIRNQESFLHDFEHSFKSSTVFQIIHSKDVSTVEPDFSVTIAGKQVSFSRYLTTPVDQIKDFFELLTEGITKIPGNLFEKVDAVASFCATLSVSDIKSVMVLIDDFVLKVDSSIRRKGQVKDIEFFLLSCSTLFYKVCSMVLAESHVNIYDFPYKVTFVMKVYMEFLCYLSGSIISQKMNERGYFLESLVIMSKGTPETFISVFEDSSIPDMKFLQSICKVSKPAKPIWKPIVTLFQRNVSTSSFTNIKEDIRVVERLRVIYEWLPCEDLLTLIYESIKSNKFANFPGESSFPVVFGTSGINKDTSLNIYLNMLIDLGKSSNSVSGRFLEKIIPLSKSAQLDVVTFCNRANILLCLSLSFKKNFEAKIDELLLSVEVKDVLLLQKMMTTIEAVLRINKLNGFSCKLRSLESVFKKCLALKEVNLIGSFIGSLNSSILDDKTRKTIVGVLSIFGQDRTLMNMCSSFVKNYVKDTENKKDLEFLKSKFSELNPLYFSDLWCLINGKLVSHDMGNWSRLIKFNEFEDEPYVYTFILRHSGLQIYQLERETFLLALAKSLISKNYSSSLNSFIREIEKFDPKLFTTKGVLAQTHRFQLITGLLSSILDNEPPYTKSRLIAVFLNFLDAEYKESNESVYHRNYLRKIAEHIVTCGGQSVIGFKDLEKLENTLGIESHSIPAKPKFPVPVVSLTQKLIAFEKMILDYTKRDQLLNPSYFIRPFPRERNSSESATDISKSRFYELCCLISVHADMLQQMPICWLFLAKLTGLFSGVIQNTKNFSQIDIFCISKTLQLFRFILKFRHGSYLRHRCLTGINIYRILMSIFNITKGTNDCLVIYELLFVFLSRDIIFHESRLDEEVHFLLKTPSELPELIVNSHIKVDQLRSWEVEERKFLHEFGKFTALLNLDKDDEEISNESSDNFDQDVIGMIF